METTNWKQHATLACEQVAQGPMSAEGFYQLWPDGSEGSALARAIFEDLEEGALHFPLNLWSGKPDYPSWHASDMYRRIVIDMEVLKADLDESRQLRIRNTVIAERDLPLDRIAPRVAELAAREDD
jgi:hypothetical protein